MDLPNLAYMAVNLLFQAPLALWWGGTACLALFVAPEARRSSGTSGRMDAFLAASVLRWRRVSVLLAVVTLAAAAARSLYWEGWGARTSPWLLLRYLALAGMAAVTAWEAFAALPLAGHEGGVGEARRPAPDATREALRSTVDGFQRRGRVLVVLGIAVTFLS